jgi:hypothetical protein
MTESDLSGLRTVIAEFVSLRRELSDEHKQTLQITVLNEELKIRWQQLLLWDEAVDKWMASYAIALVVSVSWILSTERIGKLNQLFSERDNNNSYFILGLAIVNAVYLLFITFKGYQINQLRMYIFKNIAVPLNEIAGLDANQWEVFVRRDGKPEWRRYLYYPIMTVAPFGVSVIILGMYWHYLGCELGWLDRHNKVFYFVALLQVVALVLSLSTTTINTGFRKLIDDVKQKKLTLQKESLALECISEGDQQFPPKSEITMGESSAGPQVTEAEKRGKDLKGVSLLGLTLLLGSFILAARDKFKVQD